MSATLDDDPTLPSLKDGLKVPEDFECPEQKKSDPFSRLIIHLDMDAYYAQVEMKSHNIDES